MLLLSSCHVCPLQWSSLHEMFPWKSECKSHWVMSDFLQHHGLYSVWNSPGQNTEVGSLSLLQGIFPTQGLNPGRFFTNWAIREALGNKLKSLCHFWDFNQILHFRLFFDYEGYYISSQGVLPTVVGIMAIYIKFVHSCPF